MANNSNFALAKHTPPSEAEPMRPVYNTFSYLLKVLLNSGARYLDLYILLRVHLSERSEFGPQNIKIQISCPVTGCNQTCIEIHGCISMSLNYNTFKIRKCIINGLHRLCLRGFHKKRIKKTAQLRYCSHGLSVCYELRKSD